MTDKTLLASRRAAVAAAAERIEKYNAFDGEVTFTEQAQALNRTRDRFGLRSITVEPTRIIMVYHED